MNNGVEGIVLHVQDYREHDAILRVLTKEYGKISLVARGIFKSTSKNAYGSQIFCLSNFQFNYREQNTMFPLKTCENIQYFSNIRSDLMKQSIASFMVEITDKITIDDYEVYELLKTGLTVLEKEENVFLVASLFLVSLHHMLGITPDVDECVICGSLKGIEALSYRDGGFVCSTCFKYSKHMKYSKEFLRTFRILHKADFSKLHILKDYPIDFQMFQSIYRFLDEYSGIRVNAYAFIEKLMEIDRK